MIDKPVKILEFLDMVPPKIVGGDKYVGKCYGDNARYLDLEQNVDLIFDEQTDEIYEASIHDMREASHIWRNPKYESAYIEELKSQGRYEEDSDEEDNLTPINKANISDIREIVDAANQLYGCC